LLVREIERETGRERERKRVGESETGREREKQEGRGRETDQTGKQKVRACSKRSSFSQLA
jgi:hypothetical protein